MSNIENNDNNDTKEIVEEVTPSVSTGNDGIENSEKTGEEISERATTEIVIDETIDKVAPTETSTEVEITSEPAKIETEDFYIYKFPEKLSGDGKYWQLKTFQAQKLEGTANDRLRFLGIDERVNFTTLNGISKPLLKEYMEPLLKDKMIPEILNELLDKLMLEYHSINYDVDEIGIYKKGSKPKRICMFSEDSEIKIKIPESITPKTGSIIPGTEKLSKDEQERQVKLFLIKESEIKFNKTHKKNPINLTLENTKNEKTLFEYMKSELTDFTDEVLEVEVKEIFKPINKNLSRIDFTSEGSRIYKNATEKETIRTKRAESEGEEEKKKKLSALLPKLNKIISEEYGLDVGLITDNLYNIEGFIHSMYERFESSVPKEKINDIIYLVVEQVKIELGMDQDQIVNIDNIIIPSEFNHSKFRMTNNGIFTTDKEGNDVLICSNKCFITGKYINLDKKDEEDYDEDEDETYYKLKVIAEGVEKQKAVTLNTLHTARGLMSLINFGVNCTQEDTKYVAKYFQEQIRINEPYFENEYAVEKPGWKKDGSYVSGSKRYFKKHGGILEINKVKYLDKDIMKIACGGMGKKGDVLTYSKETKPFLNLRGVRFSMYHFCGTKTLELLNVENTAIDTNGGTTSGKSESMMMCASIEANPFIKKSKRIYSEHNTAYKTEKIMIAHNGSCALFDESFKMDANELKRLVNGVTKGRGNDDEGRYCTGIMINGEHPVIDTNNLKVDLGAILRVESFEVSELIKQFKDKNEEHKAITDKFYDIKRKTLIKNYGHIIVPLIETMFEYKDKIPQLYENYLKKFRSMINEETERRRANFYAIDALGGFLLERTFEKINKAEGAEFDIMNSDETVEEMFTKFVCERPHESTGLKMLKSLLQWVDRNPGYFTANDFGKVEVIAEEKNPEGGSSKRTLSKGSNPSYTRYGALREDKDRLYIIPDVLDDVFFKDNLKNKNYLMNLLIENELLEREEIRDKETEKIIKMNNTIARKYYNGCKSTKRVYSIIWSKANELIGNKFEEEPPNPAQTQ